MPLCVIHRRDRERPVIICDYCGEEIETAADGNCQYRLQDGEERTAIFFSTRSAAPPSTGPTRAETVGPWSWIPSWSAWKTP